MRGCLPHPFVPCRAKVGLFLEHNQLSGKLPTDATFYAEHLARSLRQLELDSNALTGPVPAALGALVLLETCHLGSNLLSGYLPPGLGDGWLNVVSFDLANNRNFDGAGLAGPIPASVESLACRMATENATVCNLDGNGFAEDDCLNSPCAAAKCVACGDV